MDKNKEYLQLAARCDELIEQMALLPKDSKACEKLMEELSQARTRQSTIAGVIEREMSIFNEPNALNYQLLARLKQDCEYYLGHGNRAKKHLWAGDEAEQIAKMKELYSGFNEKPEWISLEDIQRYEAQMVDVTVETLEQAPRPS